MVGLLLGIFLVGVERGAREVFPVYLTAALLLVVLLVATRGLHLDGLMDACDGLFGGFDAQRRLDIMRDSHVGAFGVAGALAVLLLKYGALVGLLGAGGETSHWPRYTWALLLFPALSRWTMVLALTAFPYARSQGLGTPFHQGSAAWGGLLAAFLAIAAAVLLGGIGGSAMFVGVTIMALLAGWSMIRMLGGLTGDCYGAINEMAESVALVVAVGMLAQGWIEPLPLLLA